MGVKNKIFLETIDRKEVERYRAAAEELKIDLAVKPINNTSRYDIFVDYDADLKTFREKLSELKYQILSDSKEVSCGDCGKSSKSDIKLINGVRLPYSGGLVDCSKLGVGFYPNQRHRCEYWS